MPTLSLHLTPAQQSALQCRDTGLDPLTAAAWDRGAGLSWTDTEALWRELVDACNAEDAQAIEHHDRAARGASIALANLAGLVLAHA